MSVHAITWAFSQPVELSSAKFLLVALANCADGKSFECYPSISYLCDATAQNRKTVLENIKRLAGLGYIEATGGRKGRTGQIKAYRLNMQAAYAGFSEDGSPGANSPENGTVKESRKWNSTENGIVPKTDGKSPENGSETGPKTGHGTVSEPSVNRQVDAHPAGCAATPPADSIEEGQRQASLIPEPPQRSAEKRQGKKADADDCPHDQILAIWAEVLPSCVQPKAWTPERRKLLQARWREGAERQSLDWWRGLFSSIARSAFLMGRACDPGRSPFRLTLPWLLKSENFAKTMEGAYSRNGPRRPLSIHDQRSATAAALTGYSGATGHVGMTIHDQRSATIAALTGRAGSGDDILEGHARFVDDEPATGDQEEGGHD